MKLIGCAMGLMLGFGSLIGYFIAKWDLQSNQITNSQQAIAATDKQQGKPKTVDVRTIKAKTPRELLEEKYRLCVGNNGDISHVPDKVITQVLEKACFEKS